MSGGSKTMQRIRSALIALALMSTSPASAALYAGSFAGVFTNGTTDVAGQFGPVGGDLSGVPFSGEFTFDTADYELAAFASVYALVPPGFSGAATPSFRASITANNVRLDQLDVSSYVDLYVPTQFDLGNWFASFYVGIRSSNPTYLAWLQAMTTGADAGSFSLADTDIETGFFGLDDGTGTNSIENDPGIITSFSVTQVVAPVPAPAALSLFGLGTAAMLFRAQRRKG